MSGLPEMLDKFKCSDDVVTAIERYAGDSMNEDYNYIFFYGHIISENDWILEGEKLSEKAYYSYCPSCGKLFKLKKKPQNGEYIECPECHQAGSIYNFRDANEPCDMMMENHFAYIEKLDKGYVLRLFRVGLDYSDREYDDWKALTCCPNANIIEYGREYWYCGNVEYYENINDSSYGAAEFVLVDTINDSDFYIVNYEEPLNPMFDSNMVDDLIFEKPNCTTFMDWKSRQLSYSVFATLAKYGFDNLLTDYLNTTSLFIDSSKISQILMVDYNKIKSQFEVENISYLELLGLRKLKEYNIDLTEENLAIAIKADDKFDILIEHYPTKTLKYIRNIMHKHGGDKVVRDYIDYILACKKLNNDVAKSDVRMPSNFIKAHDTALELVKLEEVKIYDIPIEAMYQKYHELCEWNDGNLTVLMAKNSEDIIQEGIRQNHCVGTYCERVGKAESIVLFIRRVSSVAESFYTMEIRPDMKKLNVIQCRGYHNEDKSEEDAKIIASFTEKYTKWFNRRSSNGIDSKNVIAKYYKAVQNIDGKYISNYDSNTEYKIGETIETECDDNPDKVHVKGIHIASLEFAKRFGGGWNNVAILEVEVNLNDVIVPDAKDQIRASKVKVLRAVPLEELGEWGKRVA